jgi:hypothetical protein
MTILKKLVLSVLAAVLVLTAFPMTSVYAAGNSDPSTPPKDGQISNERLERVWARQQKLYERLGRLFDNNDSLLERAQKLIDKAKENGKDVAALQAALDAFEAAIKDARPTYESVKGIINSHQGFDHTGKVTDAEKAKATVQEMNSKLQMIHSMMGETGKALRDAIKAFREANKPAPASPDDRG